MNQRSRNSRSHAAMFGRELIERIDGLRIAKDNGDLPALCAQRSLALSASLRFGHGSGRQLAHEFEALAVRLPSGELHSHKLPTFLADGFDGESALLDCDSDQIATGLFLQNGSKCAGFSKLGVHGHLRSRRIPLMCESYTVTSDESRGISA
jgi:hypothetical protein